MDKMKTETRMRYERAIYPIVRNSQILRIFVGLFWAILGVTSALLILRIINPAMTTSWSYAKFALLFSAELFLRTLQFNEVPSLFFVTDELRKMAFSIGVPQVSVLMDILTFYLNFEDLLNFSGISLERNLVVNTSILFVAVVDIVWFYFSKKYFLNFPSIKLGRIQYLRTIFLKCALKCGLWTLGCSALTYSLCKYRILQTFLPHSILIQISPVYQAEISFKHFAILVGMLAFLFWVKRMSIRLAKYCFYTHVNLEELTEFNEIQYQICLKAQHSTVTFYGLQHILYFFRANLEEQKQAFYEDTQGCLRIIKKCIAQIEDIPASLSKYRDAQALVQFQSFFDSMSQFVSDSIQGSYSQNFINKLFCKFVYVELTAQILAEALTDPMMEEDENQKQLPLLIVQITKAGIHALSTLTYWSRLPQIEQALHSTFLLKHFTRVRLTLSCSLHRILNLHSDKIAYHHFEGGLHQQVVEFMSYID